jgi:hypothetical protein
MFTTRTFAKTQFVKRYECPSSETLLSYARHELQGLKLRGVESHLAKCEICDAESYLLARHPPTPSEDDESVRETKIPLSLLLLSWQTPPTKRDPKRTQKRRAA